MSAPIKGLESMRAQQLIQPRGFQLRTLPKPRATDLAPGEIIVRVAAGGICGSDMPFYKGVAAAVPGFDASDAEGMAPGLPLHEVVGRVVSGGDSQLAEGTRIVGWATRVDGLSEYIITRAASVIPIGESLPDHLAVVLQPLACVLHALDRLGEVRGRSVTVLGLGPIGALFAHALKNRGADHIVAVDSVDRSDIADLFGVDAFVHSPARAYAVRAHADPSLATDLVVEAIGHQSGTISDAIEILAPGGTVLYFGIPDDDWAAFPLARFVERNGNLLAGVTEERARHGALLAAVEYADHHRALLPRYVTHHFPLICAADAFAAAAAPVRGQLKVVVTLTSQAAFASERDAI